MNLPVPITELFLFSEVKFGNRNKCNAHTKKKNAINVEFMLN